LEYVKKLYALDSQSPGAIWWLGWAYLINNLSKEASEQFARVIEKNPEAIWASLSRLHIHSINENRTGFHDSLDDKLIQLAEIDHVFSWFLAECFALIGEKDIAISWLEKAVNNGRIDYHYLNEYDPLIENIRSEERFKKLMKRVKKEWENFEV
jgi:tetratricopeptide (TPR) repeat protein